jgi:hypothetical protein
MLRVYVTSITEFETLLPEIKAHKETHIALSLDNNQYFTFFGMRKNLTNDCLKKQALLML